MNDKTYLRILQGGVLVSLVTILFVFSHLLFPYITSKQLFFDIIIEVLTVFLLVFWWRYPSYRPQRNYISISLVLFFIVIFLSSIFGIDFKLSFWGDTERMLGFVDLIHFLAFYFIIITAFRTRKEWNILLKFSVFLGLVISIFSITGENIFSVFGNNAYLSIFLIFIIYYTFILLIREKNRLLIGGYIISILIMLYDFILSNVAGPIFGLAFSLLFLLVIVAIFHRKKIVKRVGRGILIFIVLFSIIIVHRYSTSLLKNNTSIRDLTFSAPTFQTRLVSWKAAYLDFKHHPFLGTGYSNYAITFDRYFNPHFYDFARTQTFFDHAHNNLIEIASTMGLLGLISYLFIFISLAWYLIRGFIKNGMVLDGSEKGKNNWELLLIFSLLLAYFIQNLALFDSFITYIYFFITSAFVYFLFSRKTEEREKEIDNTEFVKQVIAIFLLFLIMGVAIRFNIHRYRLYYNIMSVTTELVEGNIDYGLNQAHELLDGEGIIADDARTMLVNFGTSHFDSFASYNLDIYQNRLKYIASLAKENLKHNSHDTMKQLQLSKVLNVLGIISRGDEDKFYEYLNESLEAINGAINSSPGRLTLYINKSQIYFMMGDKNNALEAIKEAIDLNPNYPDPYCYLAQMHYIWKDYDEFKDNLDVCMDRDGLDKVFTRKKMINNYLDYYYKVNDDKGAKILEDYLKTLDR